jgi:hypothetical protein
MESLEWLSIGRQKSIHSFPSIVIKELERPMKLLLSVHQRVIETNPAQKGTYQKWHIGNVK